MPVFSSFVAQCIDSHSPGNDCHTSAKSQPPTGASHIKRGCQGALLVNRGNKHLLIFTYSLAADTHHCAQPLHSLRKDVLVWTSFLPTRSPLTLSSSGWDNLQHAETQRAAKVFNRCTTEWCWHDQGSASNLLSRGTEFHVKFGAKTHMIKTARCYGLKKKCSENHCVQSITTIAINCVWQTNP